MNGDSFPPLDTEDLARQISPTDISQFIRLDQCQRFLRLKMHQRAFGSSFLRNYDVAPQSIPPLLTRSGARFEQQTEASARDRYAVVNLSTERVSSKHWVDDNARVLAETRSLGRGQTRLLFQPRLRVVVDGWSIRGDVDILRLERDAGGEIRVLIADMKSSTAAKVEHRLQVAFYHRMLSTLFSAEQVPCSGISMGILYRGPADAPGSLSDEERAEREQQRQLAWDLLGARDGLLEEITDPDSYLGAVDDLVTGEHSTAQRVSSQPFTDVPYHLTYKCDGCLFNEFCMKWSAEHDDLSILPHLTEQDKGALQREGIVSTAQLAALKEPSPADRQTLIPTGGHEHEVERLSAAWPVGPRLDELIHRARRYRKWSKREEIDSISWIPSKGYGSLPYCDAQQNPNLVRIYIDAQHDYLNDRIYMLGALLVGCEHGEEQPLRRRSVVQISDGPPNSDEREQSLFVGWIQDVIRALAEVAAPDDEGRQRAPIHLIFYNSFEQRLLLDGLSRHLSSIVAATPLYDFVTQMAAFDSPLITYLDQEIRELKNYPMVCQSLQAVAANLGFDWNTPEPYRTLFRPRMFDFWGKLDRKDDDSPWYTSRARFNSQIPLEFPYAAWGDLDTPEDSDKDDYKRFRGVSVAQIQGFHARRLEAMERVAKDFKGNRQTVKSPFDIPDLASFDDRARGLAPALQEFVTIERHVDVAAWKGARLAPPERRVLAGESFVVRYCEDDQEPGVAALNREHERRRLIEQQYREEYKRERPDAKQVRLTKEQKSDCAWDQDGLCLWLRIETDCIDCGLDEMLGLTSLREGSSIILSPRWTVDSRLPVEDQAQFTPTSKQLLYMQRARLNRIHVERDAAGHALSARVQVALTGARHGGRKGFVFNTMKPNLLPLVPNEVYTIDSDPSNWYASFLADAVDALTNGEPNALFDRLDGALPDSVAWPLAAQQGQRRFVEGLDALNLVGTLHAFEASKREYIGEHGDAPILLVQGPPGTGKSYGTAFALLARLQGAMAAGVPYRVFLSCKTHAATDVLLHNVRDVQQEMSRWFGDDPETSARFFDTRLMDVPLFRVAPRETPEAPIQALPRDRDKQAGEPGAIERISAEQWCVVGAAPAGIRGIMSDRWKKEMYGQELADCLVLDEASQMNLPEAIMAAIPLKQDGQMIVVGDHRQMPPIVKHDWENEPRRTFQEYRTYRSLFETLLPMQLPMIQFRQSFRLHADMAEFLRREVYRHDGIDYFSDRDVLLSATDDPDPFVRAVLTPQHPIVVVVHDERQSQLSNQFEQSLIQPVLDALRQLGLDIEDGLGVVVPHRAQRAGLLEAMPALSRIDPDSGEVILRAVDTVERFQGDERKAILVSATESDPQYLLVSSQFLLDPRRLTVALSRAKSKMILVAARSVFNIFSANEETFEHAQIWKNLLRHTCTVPLWSGTRDRVEVEVWGNVPGQRD